MGQRARFLAFSGAPRATGAYALPPRTAWAPGSLPSWHSPISRPVAAVRAAIVAQVRAGNEPLAETVA